VIERRFVEAKRQLLTTDAHIAVISNDIGYENSAAFTRAFSKRFGISPAEFPSVRHSRRIAL
jgi:AraC-like DNA-binding protein